MLQSCRKTNLQISIERMKSVGVLLEWKACQVKFLTCVLSIGWFPDNQI